MLLLKNNYNVTFSKIINKKLQLSLKIINNGILLYYLELKFLI